MKTYISPSLLASDFSRLGEEIRRADEAGAEYIHFDVMDGHFVPNITLGPPVVKKVRPCSQRIYDVHLMIDHPEKYAPDFIKAGADIITIHVESPGVKDSPDAIRDVLETIADGGVAPGLVVKPATRVESVFPFLDICKMVLIMTVEPGFGGQEFMHDMLPKIAALRAEADAQNMPLNIEVDGGITTETAALCYENGANVFVAGTFLYGADDMAQRIADIHALENT